VSAVSNKHFVKRSNRKFPFDCLSFFVNNSFQVNIYILVFLFIRTSNQILNIESSPLARYLNFSRPKRFVAGGTNIATTNFSVFATVFYPKFVTIANETTF